MGVDAEGHKHVLGIQEGATENAAAVQDLLEGLVRRGVQPAQKRLFVIDGSKALRAAIRAVFGAEQPVQRCRAHKLRNVLDRLPEPAGPGAGGDAGRLAVGSEDRQGQAGEVGPMVGREIVRPRRPACGNGLEECFTINRLGLPASLHRCLATTNLIESPQAGVRLRTRRVCRWRDAAMVQRWVASSFLATEKNFRRLMGYQDLGC